MLRILTTSALAATLALPALAQTATTEQPMETDDATVVTTETEMAEGTDAMEMMDTANLIRTRDITGGPVYSIAEAYNEEEWLDVEDTEYYGYNNYGYGTDYEQIGEIEDIVLDQSGQMVGIVAEVGGFLDIGDKHVMVPVSDLRLVPVDDTSYSYITRLSEEQLEEMPGVDEAGWN